MKNHFIAAAAFIFLPLFCQTSNAAINLFACEPEWAALARELGGDHLHVVCATTALQDPHHIQARPSLIAKVRHADILVCTGADLEIGWLPLLLRKSANSKIQPGESGNFIATQQVNLLGKLENVDRRMGDVHAAGNPHIQFDPYRIAKVAKALGERLAEIDPDNKSLYEQNLQNFLDHWDVSIKQWEARASSLRDKPFIAHHNGWAYLIQWLGLDEIAILEPKPGVPPTSSHLTEILTATKTNPPSFILYASYQSSKAAHWLSKKTAKPVVAVSFSVPEGQTLTQWYDKFIQQLVEVAG